MDVRRLRLGEWMTGASGAVLLVATFLPWYERELVCVRAPCPSGAVSAWEAFAVVDVALMLVALLGLACSLVALLYRAPAVPMAVATITALLGTVASVLVLVRTAFPPDAEARLGGGLWLGLVATLGVAAGGWIAIRHEGYGFWPTQDPASFHPDWAPRVEVTDLPAPPADAAAPSSAAGAAPGERRAATR